MTSQTTPSVSAMGPLPEPVLHLERANPHPRDARIRFDEAAHKYFIDVDGVNRVFTISVSGVVHNSFPEFDAKLIVDKYYDNWAVGKDSKYFSLIRFLKHVMGLEEAEIKAEIAGSWSAAGKSASTAGTKTHLDVELWLNGDDRCDTTNDDLKKYHAWRATVPDWQPYRTEWSVYDEDSCIAGQIDSLWRDGSGNFHMVDWKRCKHIESEGREKGFPPFHRLPHTNLGHYTVQQNAYALILRKHYGIDCKTLSLVQLHPDCPTFLVWKLALMPDETALAFKRRADAVKAGEIVGMVEASAGKPPLTDEQRAKREVEKASDMRIMCALLARASDIEEKWAGEDSGNKRARSDAPDTGAATAAVGANNCKEIIKMIEATLDEASIEVTEAAWHELSAAMVARAREGPSARDIVV